MPIFEIFKQTISALWETKLRSFLTMFGIIWGISSVILLVGLGIGFGIDQRNHLKSIGTRYRHLLWWEDGNAVWRLCSRA